jgi:MscS family membrane protein
MLLFCCTLAGAAASAETEGPCRSPRAAAEAVLGADLSRDATARARTCLAPEGRSPAELDESRHRLKRVLRARALYVDPRRLSDDPEFSDPDTGMASAPLHATLHDVRLVRDGDGKWRLGATALDRIDELHADIHGRFDRLVARLPPAFQVRLFGVTVWQYLALALLATLGLVLRKVLAFVVKRQIRELTQHFGAAWGSHLVAAIASPGATLCAGLLLRVSYPELGLSLGATRLVELAVRLLLVFSVVWALYRLVDVVSEQFAQRAKKTESKLDDQLVPLVRKSFKAVVLIAGALFALQNFDVDVGSVLAGLGIGGLAVALAAKDTIANFFGSVMIFIDQPFQVGDAIVVKGVEGTVEEVGFRSTRIRTPYNSQVSVPNAAFTEVEIDNYGRRRYRRVSATLGLTYDTTPEQLQAFVEGVRAVILSNSYTRKDEYEVHLSGFGAHSLDVLVQFFFEVPTASIELRERHNVFLEILRLARDLGVSFAFPTRTLKFDELPAPGAPSTRPSPMSSAELAEVVRAFGPAGVRSNPHGPHIVPGGFAPDGEAGSRPRQQD